MLLYFVNTSLQTGVFIDNWKESILRPLIKDISKGTIKGNYRPVANLSFISKLVENAAINRLTDHCVKNDITVNYQSAYKQFHSCETALIKFIDEILWNMEYDKVSTLLSLDLSVAFDTVDHGILIEVLKNYYGVTDTAIAWFGNYLENRHLKVKVGDEYFRY